MGMMSVFSLSNLMMCYLKLVCTYIEYWVVTSAHSVAPCVVVMQCLARGLPQCQHQSASSSSSSSSRPHALPAGAIVLVLSGSGSSSSCRWKCRDGDSGKSNVSEGGRESDSRQRDKAENSR